MQKQKRPGAALGLLAAFLLWTILVRLIDVQPIGPESSTVGWATLNGLVRDLIGVRWSLYVMTDWLGLVPLCLMLGFALFGLIQWVKRKHLLQVDRSLLALGGCYAAVMAAYGFFELCVVNYRPVLINGQLEASYPSSTTLLVLTVMPTAIMQLNARITRPLLRRCLTLLLAAFTLFMVIGRLLSGVHWLTDIIGGVLLSAGLVMTYAAIRDPERAPHRN